MMLTVPRLAYIVTVANVDDNMIALLLRLGVWHTDSLLVLLMVWLNVYLVYGEHCVLVHSIIAELSNIV